MAQGKNGLEAFNLMDMLEYIYMILLHAFALPAARSIVTGWTWLYTLAAPEEERQSHRAVVCSALHEQIEHYRREGLGPVAIAIHVFLPMLWGIPGDIAWAAPYLPATLARNLMGASEAISRPDTLKLLAPWLAILTVWNWAFVTSGDGWPIGLALNGGMIIGMGLIWKQHLSWVPRIINLCFGVGATMMIGFLVLIVVQYRLYEIPVFYPGLLAVLSVGLAMLVTDKTVRGRVFKGRWRPVAMCWVVIAATSVVTASLFEGGLVTLLAVWAYATLVVLAFAMLFAMIFIAALGWYGGLRASATGMRLMAVGIQRLF